MLGFSLKTILCDRNMRISPISSEDYKNKYFRTQINGVTKNGGFLSQEKKTIIISRQDL